jgi:magnesium transporter
MGDMTVRTRVGTSDGESREGGADLLREWQPDQGSQLWLDIEGEISATMHEQLLRLGCHEVAITDITRERQPPKMQCFDNNTFILFRGIIQLGEDLVLQPQQIGFFVGENYLVTIHRGESLSINRVWSESEGRVAQLPTGRLALQVMDYASNRYLYRILEFEEHLGGIEDTLLSNPSDRIMAELVGYRSELRKLRRIFNYHHRLVAEILQEEPPHLGTGAEEYLHLWRVLLDRCERLFSLTSMYYEICGDLVEGYISISSHELNTTMKILTIITAIFVPLSFLAGLYGMNFEHMPELHLQYGYFYALGAMAFTAVLLIYIFKRKRWL